MADIATLGLRIDANGAIQQTEHLTGNLSTLGTTGDAVASKLKTAFGLLGIGLGFHELLQNTIAAQSALAQLDAAVRSTGGAAGFTVAQLEAQATALSRLSGAANDAVQGGLARLLSYTAIQGETFERASLAALDMAARLNVDVASAAERVGNALQYPTLALNSLTKQGFRFSEAQKQQITAFEESGQIAKAQAIILRELELAYGGAAVAARSTLGGALADLKNALFDSVEATKQQTSELVRFINATSEGIRNARMYGAEIKGIALSLAGVATAFAVAKVAAGAFVAIPLSLMLFSVQAAFGAAAVAGTGFTGVMAGLTFITTPLLAVLGPVTLALVGFLAVYATYKTLVTDAAAAEAEADAQDQDRIRRTVARIQARNAAAKAAEQAEREAAERRTNARIKETEGYEKLAQKLADTAADNVRASLERVDALRREVNEEQRMIVARRQGQDAVDALTVAIAGERIAQELSGKAMASAIDQARGLAEQRARLAIETRKAAEAEEKLTREISEAADAIAAQITAANEAAEQRTKTMLKDIQRAFADFFVNVFEQGLSSLQGFVDSFKTLFLRMIAEILASRLMARLAGVLGASLGTAGAAGAQTAGGAATGIGAAAGLGTLPLIGIGVAVVAVASIVTGFLNAGKAAKEAAKRLREFNYALDEFANTTATDLERAIAGVKKQAEELRRNAWAGLHWADVKGYLDRIEQINVAEAFRIVQLGKAAEALRLAAEQDLQVRLLRAQGFTAEADALAFALEQQREYAQALLDTKDKTYLAKLAEVQRAEAIQRTADLERESARALQDLAVRLMIARGATDETVDAMQFAIAQQREYEDAVRAGRDAVYLATLAEVQRAETIARSMAKVQGVIDGLSNTIAGLRGFADALKLSPASALSPADRLIEARRQYEAVLAAAQAGDQAAAGRLPGSAQTFLDASQAMNASGSGYAADYARVLADTEATIKLFEDAKSIQQQILDVLKEQLGVFKGLGGGIGGDIGGGIFHGPSAADAERMHQEELTEIRASVRLLAVAGEKLDRIDESVNGVTSTTRRGFEGLTLLK